LIQYYSPNFSIVSFIKALFIGKAEGKIVSFFKDYTSKKFILVTNSCRSALYLTYKSLGKAGVVITNPLTCSVALEPIIASGNRILYTDIEKDTLSMSLTDLSKLVDDRVIAVQINHQGGFSCDMSGIKNSIGSPGVVIIEDCAQGFMSSFSGQTPGKFSDVVCFSLIKNAFGIGGGILATNDIEIYKHASELKDSFKKPSFLLIIFRIIRNLLESKRRIGFINFLYVGLMRSRNKIKDFDECKNNNDFEILPSNIEMKIAYVQLRKAKDLNQIRVNNGRLLLQKLKSKGFISNYKNIAGYDSAFTKFLVVNDNFRSREHIEQLNLEGIEVKHLEQKYNHYYQERLDRSGIPELVSNISECPNYLEVHDRLFSMPLFESIKEETMDKMVKILEELLQNEKHDMV